MVKHVKVIANCTTLAKDSLISGLLQLKHVVAVSADNTNDCKILAKAHVSIGIGSDSEVIQCMCSILLQKDDINNLVDLIMFSRNIFVFIRKYFLLIFIAASVTLLLMFYSVLTTQKMFFNSSEILLLHILHDETLSYVIAKIKPSTDLEFQSPLS